MGGQGKLHLYCGDGKGKTTAACGLALRMVGAGGHVGILQFLKNGASSERSVLKSIPGISMLPGIEVEKFVFQMTEVEKTDLKEGQEVALRDAFSGDWDLLVLDEVLGAIETQTLSLSFLLGLLKMRSSSMEVVLTGRVAPPELIEEADYISEIVKRKHPYDRGVLARKGIEY